MVATPTSNIVRRTKENRPAKFQLCGRAMVPRASGLSEVSRPWIDDNVTLRGPTGGGCESPVEFLLNYLILIAGPT